MSRCTLRKFLLNAKTFLGGKKSWTSFNHFHVVLTCLSSKKSFLCELGAFKASCFHAWYWFGFSRVSLDISPHLTWLFQQVQQPAIPWQGEGGTERFLVWGDKTTPWETVELNATSPPSAMWAPSHITASPAHRKDSGLSDERGCGFSSSQFPNWCSLTEGSPLLHSPCKKLDQPLGILFLAWSHLSHVC